ncbi:hypothetical protein B6U81_06840 [Thermoplasmatales archaeon ex4484_30]|nr:MAG: hypothetical protein B6U81_06840 [Thermoplasmatales archaeon ex4484_30]
MAAIGIILLPFSHYEWPKVVISILITLPIAFSEFPYCFFGYKMKAEKARHVWSMESIVDGKRKKSILPQKNVDIASFGDEEIWVTPKVPFLIPLTIGYIVSFLLGDVLYKIISLFT